MAETVERNGYIYGAKTAKGFERMRKHGIPRPRFALQNALSKTLAVQYRKIVKALIREVKERLENFGITTDADDKEKARYIAEYLRSLWLGEDTESLERLNRLDESVVESLKPYLEKVFGKETNSYLNALKADADAKLSNLLEQWEIDKNAFFDANIKEINRLYIDNSLQRIAGETDLLKEKVLKAIVDYADGESDILDISELSKECLASTDKLSRFFARDQMQRFNKACTLATFESAGVRRVRWRTSQDGRVRESHKALDGKIYYINDLPKEIDDYNCRCGLEPVEYD